jgi:hypothetical protein
MKKTAVEWLVEQLKINNYISKNSHWLIDDAKELEIQQKDQLAIGFSGWCLEENHNIVDDGEKLLQIYKAENGL